MALILSSCETVPTSGDTALNKPILEADIETLLQEAYLSEPPQRQQLMLKAAQLMNDRAQIEDANKLLEALETEHLDTQEFYKYTVLHSDIALQLDSPFLAQRILGNPRVQATLETIETEQKTLIMERRADLLLTLGEVESSITERIRLDRLYSQQPEKLQINHNRIWASLSSLPTKVLQNRAATELSDISEGWYRLALDARTHQESLDSQQAAVNRWIALWPEHPAAMALPSDLLLVDELIEQRPDHIALLLPETGPFAPAANAIRDGFMAAYYSAAKQQSDLPELRFYDSSGEDLVNLFQSAIDNGAQAIIGPLKKEQVTDLALYNGLPIPTLTLNYASGVMGPADNLYQFGLSAEDEARQVAERAWIEGHRIAVILHDQASWGARTAEAFRQSWEELGGQVVYQNSFNSRTNFSLLVEQTMEADQSKSRWRRLQQTLASSLNYEPRRRQDVDLIFLVARPATGRQIKPALAFHYAGDLDAYSTSHIYDGSGDSSQNRDLDGIQFLSIPWLFDDSAHSKAAIIDHAAPAPNLNQLYALGADAFKLYPRLPQLQALPETQLYGLTGSLSMNRDRQIERQLIWAEIKRGKPVPINTVSEFNQL